jgi:hypothetical protein
MFTALTRPRLPRNAFIIDSAEIAAAELRRRGSRFVLSGAAFNPLPPGLLSPSFEGQNIPKPEELAAAIDEVTVAAGLAGRQRWSVLLPEAAMKTVLVTFESVPGTREELSQIISWKAERLVGVPASELRLSRQLVPAGQTPRFLVAAARSAVVEEYERLFGILGWKVGLLAPRYVGEAAWLDWDGAPGDKLLIGARDGTCTAAFVRGGELLLVRSIDGDPARLEDEVYRLALYYRDRVVESPTGASLSRVVTFGDVDVDRVSSAVGEALGSHPAQLRPIPELLEAEGVAHSSRTLAAVAGLATQAWSR